MDPKVDESFEALLRFMRDSRGFDFTGYKRATLVRRVRHRMTQAGFETYEQYLDELQASSEEFSALFNTILINVTAFFRDPDGVGVPPNRGHPADLLANASPRASRSGCGAPAAPRARRPTPWPCCWPTRWAPEAFRQRVKIYATDVDEDALNAGARRPPTTPRPSSRCRPNLLRAILRATSTARYIFSKDLRRSMIFGRHDLVKDAPISRVDLLVCRNTLMYFNAETQRHVS